MGSFFEKTLFLRSLNFLRVRHEYAIRYNFVYPLVLSVILFFLIGFDDQSILLLQGKEFIGSFVGVLSVLAPFYIAALAAIATFSGPHMLDKPFEMSKPVTLAVVSEGGVIVNEYVTPRHFLCLLFGYCTTTSIVLLSIAIFTPFVSIHVMLPTSGILYFTLQSLVFMFIFFMAQLFINTILGVYFLSDRLHRK